MKNTKNTLIKVNNALDKTLYVSISALAVFSLLGLIIKLFTKELPLNEITIFILCAMLLDEKRNLKKLKGE